MRAAAALLCASAARAAPPTVPLANGVDMPAIALGVGGYKSAEAQSAITAGLAAGFTHIDTAHDYNNYPGVSAALKTAPRDSYFLTMKVPGCGVPGLPGVLPGLQEPCLNNTVKEYTDDLAAVGVESADLLLIHFGPLLGCGRASGCEKVQQQWAALEELYAAKKVKAIGVSNFCPSCLECVAKASKVTPMVNQVQYHVGQGASPQAGLRDYCAARGIVLEAYSALGGGKLPSNDATVAAGAAHGKSGAQAALRWVSQQGVPLVTRASDPTYLKEDLDIFAWNLTAAEVTSLDAVTDPGCYGVGGQGEAPGGCCK